MKIVLLANDNVSYSGILSYPLLKNFSNDISGIFIQDGILNSNSSSLDLFRKIKNRSGLQYALSLTIETINYKIGIFIRNLFHMNKHENDCYLESNEKFGRIFGIPIFKMKGSVNDKIWIEKINELKPDLIICIRYAEILKKSIIDIPQYGVINFHSSLLPKYKGLGPIFQAMLHNEKEIGFSFHYIDEEIDTGKIIKQKIIPIRKNDSVSRVNIRAHVSAGNELVTIIKNFKNNKKQNIEINKNDESYFSWPEKTDTKKFFKSNKKYVLIKDLFSLIFYNPNTI